MQWIETSADVSLSRRLQLIGAEAGSEPLLLIEGNTIYHPSVLQKAKEWNGETGRLVLISGDKAAGIYGFTAEAICDLSNRCPAQAGTFQELLAPVQARTRYSNVGAHASIADGSR